MADVAPDLAEWRIASMTQDDQKRLFDIIPWDSDDAGGLRSLLTRFCYLYFSRDAPVIVTPIVDEDTETEAKGQTLLHAAIGHRARSAAEMLVDICSSQQNHVYWPGLWEAFRDHKDANGMTALNLAARCDDLATAIDLVRANASTRPDVWNNSELHNAVLSDGTAVLGYLLSLPAWQATLNIVGSNGKTALNVAAGCGKLDAVQALLAAGARVTADDDGNNELHNAALSGNTAVLGCILNHLSRDPLDLNAILHAKNAQFEPCLHVAARTGIRPSVQLLLSNNANVNGNSSPGMTAAHVAAEEGHKHILEELHQAGAHLEVTSNAFRSSPLHLAAANRRAEAVNFLVDNNVQVNDGDFFLNTPLHLAMMHNYPDIARLLLEAGASRTMTNAVSRTPELEGVANESTQALQVLRWHP